MRLTHLVVSNIGSFRGPHVFDFGASSDLNGFAFFAENGRGKTSLYNAMRWALWGEVSPRLRALRGAQIRPPPIPIVGDPESDILLNTDALRDDTKAEMSVVLFAEKTDNSRIQVMRTATSTTTLPRSDDEMEFSLVVNVGEVTSSSDDAQAEIERFFPRELERFFFIDGEALGEYTDMLEQDSERGLKEDIVSVLRLPTLTRGREDLKRIAGGVEKRLSKTKRANKSARRAQREYHSVQRDLKQCQEKLRALESRISVGSKRLAELDEIQRANEGLQSIYDERSRLEGTISILEQQLEYASRERASHSKDAWKTLIWKRAGPLHEELDRAIDRINNATFNRRELNRRIEKNEESLQHADLICPTCNQEVESQTTIRTNLESKIQADRKALAELEGELTLSSAEATIRMGRLVSLRPARGAVQLLKRSDEDWRRVRADLLNAREEIDDLNGRISGEDSESIDEIQKEWGRLQATQKADRTELQQLEKQAEVFTRDMAHIRRKLGTDDDSLDSEIEDLLARLIKTIDGTLETYVDVARKRTTELASEAFMAMTNAPQTYSGVELDREFRGRILRHNGLTAVRPSSGMKSIMTVSIIDALRQVSGLKAPVFFDTPGRSLDKPHQKEFLEHFWRGDHGHQHQFVIFAHSGEFSIAETIEQFGERIAKAWQLKLPGDYRDCTECGGDIIHDRDTQTSTCLNDGCLHQWNTSVLQSIAKELSINVG